MTSSDSKIDVPGSRENGLNMVDGLYKASIRGDWETADLIFRRHSELVLSPITMNLDTSLHVAATAEETKHTINFVNNLVKRMTAMALEQKNKLGNTAFHIACVHGNTEMAKIMMKKNEGLLNIRGYNNRLPLTASALAGKHSLVEYLYNCDQTVQWEDQEMSNTLLYCVKSGFFDIAFQIVQDNQELDIPVFLILEVLVKYPEAFNSVEKNLITRIKESIFRFFHMEEQFSSEEVTNALKLLRNLFGSMDDDGIKYVYEKYAFDAAEAGNTQFIVELLQRDPTLMLTKDDTQQTIFHIAVTHHHLGIYNLLYEIGDYRNEICILQKTDGNNILHLVGCKSNSSSKFMAGKMSEASLLMQRELLWFKDVYEMMPPYLREAKNYDHKTPYELFSEKNHTLISQGLKWMKDCMVVSTLIITIAFAVAFTVPGGYDQGHGLPVFIHRVDFLVFVIADAISLFSASTSLLLFLSILTSSLEQLDFLFSLPRKLLAGMVALFISIATMMITFSSSFFVLYHDGLKWVPIFIAVFATIPVIVFAILQFHILVDMIRSMYDSRYLFKPKKRILYTRK